MFKSKHSEMQFVIQKDGSGGQHIGNSDAVVRLRGLPFQCTHEDITNFFKGRFCHAQLLALHRAVYNVKCAAYCALIFY